MGQATHLFQWNMSSTINIWFWWNIPFIYLVGFMVETFLNFLEFQYFLEFSLFRLPSLVYKMSLRIQVLVPNINSSYTVTNASVCFLFYEDYQYLHPNSSQTPSSRIPRRWFYQKDYTIYLLKNQIYTACQLIFALRKALISCEILQPFTLEKRHSFIWLHLNGILAHLYIITLN